MSAGQPRPALGVESTVAALGETQLSAPRPAGEAPPALAQDGARYVPVGSLGAGGMGVVDRIWDGDLMRDLAVKRIRGELREDPRMVAQFLWEARVTAYLDHPNIVPVHDLGTSPDGGPFFVMKRAEGTPLDRWIERLRTDGEARRAMTRARALRIFRQICQAIAFAHRRGVLHRDLKPANVIVGDTDEVLVMDWGLAIPLAGPAGERLRAVMPGGLTALSAGTPLYMSPEQARGEPLDERSDVFTLGVMLYELVSLERAFEGASAHEVSSQVSAARVRPFREVCPEAPRSLAAVVERTLQPAPADRYASVDALIADLDLVLEGHTPKAEAASPVRRLARSYLAGDRAFARLRVMDVDFMVASGSFAGVAGATAWADLHGLWWVWAILAVVFGVPPSLRWLRARRELRDGLTDRS